MFDAKIRPLINPALNYAAELLARTGLTPNQMTAIGFFFGLLAFSSLALAHYAWALFFIVLSRLADGLDGPLARHESKESDLGAFLDIVSDFIFYSGCVFFFVLGQPQHALWAAFLIFCFVGSGSSFLAYAVIAAKRGINHERQGKKSFYYLGGLAEGSETIFFLVLMCLVPAAFPYLAGIFGTLCLLTAAGRVRQGMQDFSGSGGHLP